MLRVLKTLEVYVDPEWPVAWLCDPAFAGIMRHYIEHTENHVLLIVGDHITELASPNQVMALEEEEMKGVQMNGRNITTP